jgi:4-hydroxy-tetrahydrodipicolinate reductase
MNIALIGYGKMGKALEKVAVQKGHRIAHIIQSANKHEVDQLNPGYIDIAIEFSEPASAYENVYKCLSQGVSVVSGTTGWLEGVKGLEQYCREQNGAFFYASNFSISVNIFFKINQLLAKLMSQQADYKIQLEETHHTAKKDAPSGTAITLAEDILAYWPHKKGWSCEGSNQEELIPILSKRIGDAAGIHQVTYTSLVDRMMIQHTAYNRQGFALGAILVAEWLQGKKGVFNMNDFLALHL